MALQNKLKAFVRFDGSGRVIPSSLILQKSKPKVGNWKEINATQCCNNSSSTTTTTTTMFIPTLFTQQYWVDVFNACNSTLDGTFSFFSASPVLQPGIFVFTDSSLTVKVQEGRVIYEGGMFGAKYLVGMNGELILYDCPTTTTTTTQPSIQEYRISSTGCQGCPDGCSEDLNSGSYVYAEGPAYATPRALYVNLELTIPFTGTQGLYQMMQEYPSGQGYSVYIENGQMINVTGMCAK